MIQLLLVIGSVAGMLIQIEGKTCDCGNWCDKFKGKIEDDTCYFIAKKNSLYGNQYIVSDTKQETFLINVILNGLKTRKDMQVSTNLGYQFKEFHQECSSCNDTVYVKKCECKLNVLETVVKNVKLFHDMHNELFWVTVVIIALLFSLILFKCFCRMLTK